MAKKTAGLPPSFDLQVEKPVDLGDYLDDGFGREEPLQKGTPMREESTGSAKAKQIGEGMQLESRAPIREAGHAEADKLPKKRTIEPPRKQVNMKPETMRKAEELLQILQRQGPQRDVAASEMFDALISALYEAKGRIDLSTVPKRGRWGTPTAAAFVESLRAVFQRAIQMP